MSTTAPIDITIGATVSASDQGEMSYAQIDAFADRLLAEPRGQQRAANLITTLARELSDRNDVEGLDHALKELTTAYRRCVQALIEANSSNTGQGSDMPPSRGDERLLRWVQTMTQSEFESFVNFLHRVRQWPAPSDGQIYAEVSRRAAPEAHAEIGERVTDALLVEAKRQQTIEEFGLDIQFHGDGGGWRVFQHLNAKKTAPDGNLYEGDGATLAEAFDNWRCKAGV